MSASEDRRALRAAGRSARRKLTGDARAAAEDRIAAHLASLALPADTLIAVSCADDGEPDLGTFGLLARSLGHRLALPVPAPDADVFTMQFQPWFADDELRPGRFDILCPPERAPVEPDVVMVPLVRFDPAGNRMGRGAGFYDRYLGARDHLRPANVMTFGVAFEAQRCDALPVQAHDVPLGAIVTELGIRWRLPTGAS